MMLSGEVRNYQVEQHRLVPGFTSSSGEGLCAIYRGQYDVIHTNVELKTSNKKIQSQLDEFQQRHKFQGSKVGTLESWNLGNAHST